MLTLPDSPSGATGGNVTVDVQYASVEPLLPTRADIEGWVAAVFALLPNKVVALDSDQNPDQDPGQDSNIELTVRIVDEEEILDLNRRYRGQEKTTNVLSFACDLPGSLALNLLGDIIVCAPVVESEAICQHKARDAHWAHMIAHGLLHLLGFDHISERQAVQMESIETIILAHLRFPNPYEALIDIL